MPANDPRPPHRKSSHAPTSPNSLTGLSRWSIAAIGLIAGVIAVVAAIVLVGAASPCGLDENPTPTGYCAASDTVRSLLDTTPVLTVIVGYALSLRAGRLTPIAVAALCAVAQGVIALTVGY